MTEQQMVQSKYTARKRFLFIMEVKGVPRHFLFVSLSGTYWGKIQYGCVGAHKESLKYDMLGGSEDMPSRKILKIQVLWDVIWCNLGT